MRWIISTFAFCERDIRFAFVPLIILLHNESLKLSSEKKVQKLHLLDFQGTLQGRRLLPPPPPLCCIPLHQPVSTNAESAALATTTTTALWIHMPKSWPEFMFNSSCIYVSGLWDVRDLKSVHFLSGWARYSLGHFWRNHPLLLRDLKLWQETIEVSN